MTQNDGASTMASFSTFVRRAPLPAVATYLYQTHKSACEAEKPAVKLEQSQKLPPKPSKDDGAGMKLDKEGIYHGLFPKSQLFQPKLEYPLWDDDWDGRKPELTGDKEADRERMRHVRKTGVTRHIILIRHGQYDETYKEDEKRVLTELGRKQADLTGKRIAEMIRGAGSSFGAPCKVKVVRVSNLERAKESADIIAQSLPGVERAEPDPLLNEGRPAHTIPGGAARPAVVETVASHHSRIEEAFQKYFYRAPFEDDEEGPEEDNSEEGEEQEKDLHEFEIIVCHANVIRYFLCR